jgi:hypothetical protein
MLGVGGERAQSRGEGRLKRSRLLIEDTPTKHPPDVSGVLSSGLTVEVRLSCRDGRTVASFNPNEPD